MADPKDACVQAARGPIGAPMNQSADGANNQTKGETKMMARVGKPAPDFEASAFADGGFNNLKLSDYKGEWVVLCFYPGDFTFV